MKCGVCGDELLEASQVQLACSTCAKDVPVHASCQATAKTNQLRVGCSEHPVTQLPVLASSSDVSKKLMGPPKPMMEVQPKELVKKLQAEAELLKKRKVEMEALHKQKPQSPMRVPMHRPMGLGMMGGPMMGGPMMGEGAPWAMGGMGRGGGANANKKRKKNFAQMMKETCEAAVEYAPKTRVTYTRLDRLHDAWNAFELKGCGGGKNCGCARCVTMDILTMTHIVELKHFEAQLGLLVQYITEVCQNEPWALASLMPGKSNFWLCGWLANSIPKNSQCLPSCLYLTSVNDTKSFLPYPWVEFRDDDSSEPKHVFVLDDVSYSGTQFSNLLRQVRTNAPADATVHACPLFVTPHAELTILGGMKGQKGLTYWKGRAPLLDNDKLFATLGEHRESKAKNFFELCKLYAGREAWSDARWLEHGKTLTTYVPYYKIPDYFSCPEKAYITPQVDKYSEDISEYTFTKEDQSPEYKKAESYGLIRMYLQ